MKFSEAQKLHETDIVKGVNGKDYVFFWGGPYSNWFPQPFEYLGTTYNCSEQFMMEQKALLFGDREIANLVMEAKHPDQQKRLGRQVKGFDKRVWEGAAVNLMAPALAAKFTSTDWLKKTILGSGNAIIVEASPVDQVWGVGLARNDPAILDEENWRGMNLLGISLMQARDIIRARDE